MKKTINKMSNNLTRNIKHYLYRIKTNNKINDVQRWENVASETHKWDARNILIASLIPKSSSVLDVGAGAQTLRGHLIGCKYVACDLVKKPETVYCDLNNKVFPIFNERFNYTVCSGVIEYLVDPRGVIDKLSYYGDNLIISYAPLSEKMNINKRKAAGWVNHFAKTQIEDILNEINLWWALSNFWNDQYIYIIRRKS